MGIFITYYDTIKEHIYDCDALLLDSKYFSHLWKNRQEVLSLLKKIKEVCNCVIWLDSTASTGTAHFQVMPYVDRYWKKQLLKERSLYEQKFYGERIYTDYYKELLNLSDEQNNSESEPIKKEDIGKLSVSWNIGLGPYATDIRISNLLRLLPWALKGRFTFKYRQGGCMSSDRKVNTVCFRGSSDYLRTALSFQRIETIGRLSKRGIHTAPVSYGKYIKEIRRALIAVSPFGFGEVCYRDFEIILSGTLLFKPSMEHLETYPDVYVRDKTYVPFKWDFSDFDEILDGLLRNTEKTREIIQNANRRYRYFLSKDGQEEFCMRFKALLANAISEST